MPEVTMNPGVWFEIYVDDMARAQSFYAQVMQTEFSTITDGELEMKQFSSSPDAPGISGALVKMADMPAGNNSTVIYLGCQDCAVEASRVEAAGGTLMRDKFSIGEYGFCALAIDTEGNIFGLHSMQ